MTAPTIKFISENPDNVYLMTPTGKRFSFKSHKLETSDAEIIETIRKRIAGKLDDTEEVLEFPPEPKVADSSNPEADKLRAITEASLNLANENDGLASPSSVAAINAAITTAATTREPGNGAGLVTTSKISVGSKASNVK